MNRSVFDVSVAVGDKRPPVWIKDGLHVQQKLDLGNQSHDFNARNIFVLGIRMAVIVKVCQSFLASFRRLRHNLWRCAEPFVSDGEGISSLDEGVKLLLTGD